MRCGVRTQLRGYGARSRSCLVAVYPFRFSHVVVRYDRVETIENTEDSTLISGTIHSDEREKISEIVNLVETLADWLENVITSSKFQLNRVHLKSSMSCMTSLVHSSDSKFPEVSEVETVICQDPTSKDLEQGSHLSLDVLITSWLTASLLFTNFNFHFPLRRLTSGYWQRK